MGIPQFSSDVLDFIELLNKHQVEYLLVGGSAVIYFGYARYTGDVDFFYQSTQDNAERLYLALEEFWAGPVPEVRTYSDLLNPGEVIQFGVPPHRIDLLNKIDGVSFEEAVSNSIDELIEQSGKTLKIKIISYILLKKNKKASGRAKDLDDLANL